MMDYAFAVFDNEINTYTDWGLMLEHPASIPLPVAQTVITNIPGGTPLDLTEVLTGVANFNTRTLNLPFSILSSYDDIGSLTSRIANYLHGQKKRVVFDNDPSFFYYGRFSVDTKLSDASTADIVIVGVVDPYKYEIHPQSVALTVTTSKTIKLQNTRMPVVPTITSDAIMTVTFGGVVYALAVGENIIPEVCLMEGENTLLFTGTGSVTLTYTRGQF